MAFRKSLQTYNITRCQPHLWPFNHQHHHQPKYHDEQKRFIHFSSSSSTKSGIGGGRRTIHPLSLPMQTSKTTFTKMVKRMPLLRSQAAATGGGPCAGIITTGTTGTKTTGGEGGGGKGGGRDNVVDEGAIAELHHRRARVILEACARANRYGHCTDPSGPVAGGSFARRHKNVGAVGSGLVDRGLGSISGRGAATATGAGTAASDDDRTSPHPKHPVQHTQADVERYYDVVNWIYYDQHCGVIVDAQPKGAVHCMIFPRRVDIRSLNDIDGVRGRNLLEHMYRIAKEVIIHPLKYNSDENRQLYKRIFPRPSSLTAADRGGVAAAGAAAEGDDGEDDEDEVAMRAARSAVYLPFTKRSKIYSATHHTNTPEGSTSSKKSAASFCSSIEQHVMLTLADRDCYRPTPETIKFLVGFKSLPALPMLHMDVVSADLCGTGLLHPRQYNQLASSFFIPATDIIADVKKHGYVTLNQSVDELKRAENTALHCGWCGLATPGKKGVNGLFDHVKGCLPFRAALCSDFRRHATGHMMDDVGQKMMMTTTTVSRKDGTTEELDLRYWLGDDDDDLVEDDGLNNDDADRGGGGEEDSSSRRRLAPYDIGRTLSDRIQIIAATNSRPKKGGSGSKHGGVVDSDSYV